MTADMVAHFSGKRNPNDTYKNTFFLATNPSVSPTFPFENRSNYKTFNIESAFFFSSPCLSPHGKENNKLSNVHSHRLESL